MKSLLFLALFALSVGAQPNPPSFPMRSETLDRFGGDTRVASADPRKGQMYTGTITAVNSATLTDSNAHFPTDGSLVGKLLNPNLAQGDSGNRVYAERFYRIVSNTATSVTVDSGEGSLTDRKAAPGKTYEIMSPFTLERIGNRWWMIDPAGHGFFAKSVSKVDINDSYSSSTQYDAVYLQHANGSVSSNLAVAAWDTHPDDVVDGGAGTVSAKGDAIYIGWRKPFWTTGFYMNTLGAGGAVRWYYSTADGGWKPINGNGNPASAAKLNPDKTFNFDVGNWYANGLGSVNTNGNRIQWWTAVPEDHVPVRLPNDSTPRYYIKGEVAQDFATAPRLGRVFDATSLQSAAVVKYGLGNNAKAWFDAMNKRLDDWGLNATGQYSYKYWTIDGFYPTTRKPFQGTVMMSKATMDGSQTNRVKSIYDGIKLYPGDTNVTWQGLSADVFDPQYQQAVEAYAPLLKPNPYMMFLTTDEADHLYAIDVQTHPHGGYVTLMQNPYKPVGYSGGAANRMTSGVTYSDPKLYSKYALRDMLRYAYKDSSDSIPPFTVDTAVPAYRYSDSPSGSELAALRNLNRAWGTRYTTWGTSRGNLDDGSNAYGRGTGFMDENGGNICPTRSVCADVSLGGFQVPSHPAIKQDLDNFVQLYAAKLGKVVTTAARKYTNNLLALPIYEPNEHVAHGLKPYFDLLWFKPADAAMAKAVYDNFGKPLFAADYKSGDFDSPEFAGGKVVSATYNRAKNRTTFTFSGHPYNLVSSVPLQFPESRCSANLLPTPPAKAAEWDRVEVDGDYTGCVRPGHRILTCRAPLFALASNVAVPSQRDRFEEIRSFIDFSVGTKGSDGNYFTVGWEHWALQDNAPLSPREYGPYGFITAADNAYDGYEATRSIGKDASGRWVGGEDFDYENLLVPLSRYLHSLYDALISGGPAASARHATR